MWEEEAAQKRSNEDKKQPEVGLEKAGENVRQTEGTNGEGLKKQDGEVAAAEVKDQVKP